MKKFLLKLLFLGCVLGMFGIGKAYADPNISNPTANPNSTVLVGGAFTISSSITQGFLGGNLNSVKLTGPTGTTITFTNPAGTNKFGTYTSATITAPTTPGNYIYTVTARDAGGIINGTQTNTITITVLAAPTASVTSSCNSATLTATSTNPTGGNYIWYDASNTVVQNTTSATFVTSVPGTYSVSYKLNGVETAKSSPGTVVTITTPPVISSTPGPAANLYLSYPFTGPGTAANTDASGNGNTAIPGGATLTADRYGIANSAYSLNGTSAYITTTNPINNTSATQSFSFSMWFKTAAGYNKGGKLIGFGTAQTGLSAGGYDRQLYMTNTGQIIFGVFPNQAKTISTTDVFNDGSWHHVVATFSGTNGSNLYMDGVLAATDPTMNAAYAYPAPGTGYWRIGYDNVAGWPTPPTSNFFAGALDDIAVYKTELSASDAQTLYGAWSNHPCVGSPFKLNVNTVTGATYSWTGPGGYTSNIQNPTVTPTAAATNSGTYTVTVKTGTCTSTATVDVVVNSAVFTRTGAGPVYTFTPTAVIPGATYTWDFNGGTILTGSGSSPYTVQWSTAGTKTITLTVTDPNGCTIQTTQTLNITAGTTSTFNDTYGFRKTITFKGTLLGISSTLTNFPALIIITDPDLVASGMCADKVYNPTGAPNPTNLLDYDFAFVDPGTGTELNYEVVSYDKTAGKLIAWVKLPSVTNTDYPFNFYYGSTAATHTAAFHRATWTTDYMAIYHFDEGSTSGANTILDATSNIKSGTPTNTTIATDQIVGKAYTFNSNTAVIKTPAEDIPGNFFTLSAWVKMSSVSNRQVILTNERITNAFFGTVNGYHLAIANPGNATNPVYAETETNDGFGNSNTADGTGGANVTTGVWHHIQGVYNGNAVFGAGTLTNYVDGVVGRTLTLVSDVGTPASNVVIGQDFDGTHSFKGIIDEVRISNGLKSADWIKAEYYNQNPTTQANCTVVNSGTTVNSTYAGSGTVYTWTGNTDTDPTKATNWTNTTSGTANQAPPLTGIKATWVIPTGLTKYPVLTSDVGLYGLTVADGASLNLNGHVLTVGCNIYNNTVAASTGGILYGNNPASTITWNGTTAQTYTGVSTSKLETGNMNVGSAAVTINGGPLNIYNVLKLNSGNLTVGTGALTLKSTSATNTASLDKITSTGRVIGTVNVERYMTGGNATYNKRGYRFLSLPVNNGNLTATTIPGYTLAALQKTTPITGWGIISPPAPAFATTPPATFDPTPTGNPSVFFYYEPDKDPANRIIANSDYKAINSPTEKIPVGNGVLFFFRGDRTVNASKFTTTYVPENTILNNAGTLNQGDVFVNIPKDPRDNIGGHTVYTEAKARLTLNPAFTATTTTTPNTDGFHLVGNPYASPIDLDIALNSTNFTNQFSPTNNYVYELDNSGAFISYLIGSGTTAGNSTGVGSTGFSRFAASGQGFLIHCANNATLTFHEASKAGNSVSISNSFATAANVAAPPQVMHINLMLDSANANETVIQFGYNHASNKFDPKEDAAYMTGPQQTTYLTSYSSDDVPCLINQMNKLDSVKTITLYVGGSSSGRYTLTFSGAQSLDPRYRIFLKDSFMNDSLDVSNNTTYQFDLDLKNSKTFGDKRFILVVEPTHIQDTYQLSTFAATKNNNSVQLNWKTDHEGTYTDFKVQRSIDGGDSFVTIGDVQSDGSGNYGFTDTNPLLSGSNKYRIFQTVDSTVTKTSSVITVTYSTPTVVTATNILKVYPNPASTILNVAIKTAADGGPLLMRIYNMKSQLVMSHTFSKDSTLSMDVSKLITGNYVIHVTDSKMDYGSVTFTKL